MGRTEGLLLLRGRGLPRRRMGLFPSLPLQGHPASDAASFLAFSHPHYARPSLVLLRTTESLQVFHILRKNTLLTPLHDFSTFCLVPALHRSSSVQERMSEKTNLDMFRSPAVEAVFFCGPKCWAHFL